ncbi:MAG: sulfoxide reductase heme-binding subunit YedZ [Acetobacteraceae bacterium]|nr:sulfoxide reductase heme-binding subunit YedZ [Acetobacteraceae bacterium]
MRSVMRNWTWPWQDRHRRLVPIKAITFALALLPALVLAVEWQTVGLGAEPVKAAVHIAGLWTIRILLMALAVTPARSAFNWAEIMLVRRMIGVTALGYGLLHFCLFVALQGFSPVQVATEIVSRWYLAVGFVALLGLVALGVTSTNGWMRRLGKNWKRLHRLAYVIGALGLLHYFMQSKANISEAVFTAGLFVWLMLWRLLAAGWRNRAVALLGLALGSGVITAMLEAGWYAVATRVPAWRVWDANFQIAYGLRPGAWVAVATLAVGALSLAWLRVRPPPRRSGGARPLRRIQPADQPSA